MVDRLNHDRSKGFGFVTFEDASNADQLVGKIGLVLDDKQVIDLSFNGRYTILNWLSSDRSENGPAS